MNDDLSQLKKYGSLADHDLPLGDIALILAALDKPGRDTGRYHHHFKMLKDHVAQRFHDLRMAGADDDAATRIAALKHVICDEHGYDGDRDTYDDLRNADMMETMDRRKGLPITLSILVMVVARAVGWDVAGINFPGHFLVRITHHSTRIIFDPFNKFEILGAPELRQLLKRMMGDTAELSANFYADASNRDTILRLQNNIKSRRIAVEDYTGALTIIERMRLFVPDDLRLLFDCGVLQAKVGNIKAAIDVMEGFIGQSNDKAAIADARRFLAALKSGLN